MGGELVTNILNHFKFSKRAVYNSYVNVSSSESGLQLIRSKSFAFSPLTRCRFTVEQSDNKILWWWCTILEVFCIIECPTMQLTKTNVLITFQRPLKEYLMASYGNVNDGQRLVDFVTWPCFQFVRTLEYYRLRLQRLFNNIMLY